MTVDPESKAPTSSYLICSTARSGSTLLAGMLAGTGVAGKPDEYFERGAQATLQPPVWEAVRERQGIEAFLRKVFDLGTTPNGVFAAKVRWANLKDLREMAPPGDPDESLHTRLARIFPGLRYVWITRRDKIRQAVSVARALQTERWTSRNPADDRPAVAYSFTMIDFAIRSIILQESDWAGYFLEFGVAPVSVVYEDLAADPDGVTRRVLGHLGIDFDGTLAAPPLERQADELNEEWVRRYRASERRWHALRSVGVLPSVLVRAPLRRAYAGRAWRELTRRLPGSSSHQQ